MIHQATKWGPKANQRALSRDSGMRINEDLPLQDSQFPASQLSTMQQKGVDVGNLNNQFQSMIQSNMFYNTYRASLRTGAKLPQPSPNNDLQVATTNDQIYSHVNHGNLKHQRLSSQHMFRNSTRLMREKALRQSFLRTKMKQLEVLSQQEGSANPAAATTASESMQQSMGHKLSMGMQRENKIFSQQSDRTRKFQNLRLGKSHAEASGNNRYKVHLDQVSIFSPVKKQEDFLLASPPASKHIRNNLNFRDFSEKQPGELGRESDDGSPRRLAEPQKSGQLKYATINLEDEYRQHLQYMSMLNSFNELKLNWDHTFFKSVILPNVDSQDKEKVLPGLEDYGGNIHEMCSNLIEQDMNSIVDSEYRSFIPNETEKLIPKKSISIKQNRKLISIWLESKQIIEEEIRKQQKMTTRELEKASTVAEMKDFFKSTIKILERFMKVMAHEEGNLVGTLLIDQLFKCVLIKLDSVFTIKESIVKRAQQQCNDKVRVMREACTGKLDLQLTQFDLKQKGQESEHSRLMKKIDTQTKIIDKLQANLNDEKQEIKYLVSHDSRLESLKELQEKFDQINDLLYDNLDQKTTQYKLLKEYTKMINIGTTKIPRFDVDPQTDISHLKSRKPAFTQVVDLKSDKCILEKVYEPIEQLSFGSKEPRVANIGFGRLFQVCEDLIDGNDPREEVKKKSKSFPQLLLPQPVQSTGEFQRQFLNFVIKERDQADAIRDYGLSFISSLARSEKDGFVFAKTISKLFGFREVKARRGLTSTYFNERANYQAYFMKEKEKKLVMDDKSMIGLNLLKATNYLRNNFQDSPKLGRKILSLILGSLTQKTCGLLNILPIGSLFSVDDVQFPPGSASESGEEDQSSFSSKARKSRIERGITFIQKEKKKFSPQFCERFSQVMVSLYAQCSYKQLEIQTCLKNYDTQKQSGQGQILSAAGLKEALMADNRFWISTQESEIVFKFLDPMSSGSVAIRQFLELFQNENLFAFTSKSMINNTIMLNSIFEGLETMVSDLETRYKTLLEKHSEEGAKSSRSLFATFSSFQSVVARCVNDQIPLAALAEAYQKYILWIDNEEAKKEGDAEVCRKVAQCLLEVIEDFRFILN